LPIGTYRHRLITPLRFSLPTWFALLSSHVFHYTKTTTTIIPSFSRHTLLFVCLLLLEPMIAPLRACGRFLEASGAAVLHRQPSSVVGHHLEQAGIALKNPAIIATNDKNNDVGGNGMILAGGNLQEKSPAPQTSGSNWMKQQRQ
jgi:hypothetical protein